MAIKFLNKGTFSGDVEGVLLISQKAAIPPSDGYIFGRLSFKAYSSGTTYSTGANITAVASAAWSSNGLGTGLQFSTTSDTSVNPVNRMYIASNGYVGIDTADPGAKLHVNQFGASGSQTVVAALGSTSLRPVLQFSENHTNASITSGMSIEYNGVGSGDANHMAINSVTGAARFIITSGGSMQLPTYGAGTLVTDASGNITVSSGGGAGGPYLPLAGGTMAGSIAMTNFNISGVNQISINDPGEGIVFQGTTNVTLLTIDDATDSILKISNASALQVNAKITNLTTPTSGGDATNKTYVDDAIAGVPQGDITAVTAGTFLTGGGTSGDVTLNADTSKLAHIVDSANASVTAGWITVAEADTARRAGEIYVTDGESGDHSFIRIDWMRSYNDSNFTVLNCGGHQNRIQGVRVLQETADSTYGPKYLQVKVTVTSNYYVIITAPGTIPNYSDFTAVTPVLENTKTGYSVTGAQLEDLQNSSVGTDEGITVGGALYVNGTGDSSFVGNVGIGTDSPSEKLSIETNAYNNAPEYIEFTDAGAGSSWVNGQDYGGMQWYTVDGTGIGAHTVAQIKAQNETSGAAGSGALVFSTAPYNTVMSERMRINQNGVIRFNAYGAGTLVTDAQGNVTVSGGGGAGGPYLPLVGGTMAGQIIMGDAGGSYSHELKFANDTYIAGIDFQNSGELRFIDRSGGKESITFNLLNGSIEARNTGNTVTNFISTSGNSYFNGGNVGIGTTSPDAKLHVEGNVLIDAYNQGEDNGLFFREGFLTIDQPSITVWDMSNTGASPDGLSINSNDGIRFRENGGEVARFKDGNFGIGTTDPGSKLEVVGRITIRQSLSNTETNYINTVARGGGGSDADMRLGNSVNGDVLTVHNAGVGIRTVSPAYTLDVAGVTQASGFKSKTGTYSQPNKWQKVLSLPYSAFSFDAFTLEATIGGDTSNLNTNAEIYINFKFQNNNGRIYANIVNYGDTALLAENFEIYRDGTNGLITIYQKIVRNYQTPAWTLTSSPVASNPTWYGTVVGTDLSGETNDAWTAKTIINTVTTSMTSGNVGIGTTSPAAAAKVTLIGNQTFGLPGNGANDESRWLSIEGNTDGSGEGSGRIFFTEHNSTTAAMDNYGMSIGYRGGSTSVVGASGNTWTGLASIGNGDWGMWGHNNDAIGAMIMSGDRAATYVSFRNNIVKDVSNLYVAGNIYHTGDTNNYISFGTDVQSFYTNGSSRIYIRSGGNVGISNTSPDYPLDVSGLTRSSSGFSADGNARIVNWEGSNTAGTAAIKLIATYSNVAQGDRIKIEAVGNISYGAGTDTVVSTIALQMNNNNLLEGSWWQEGGDHSAFSTTGGASVFVRTVATGTYEIYVRAGQFSSFAFTASCNSGTIVPSWTTITSTIPNTNDIDNKWSLNRAIYENNGNVGIGTASPTTSYSKSLQIHASGNGSSLRLTDAGSTSGVGSGLELLQYGTDSYIINREIGPMYFLTSSTTQMTILANGNVGIGVTSPSARLSVESPYFSGGVCADFKFTGSQGSYYGVTNIKAEVPLYGTGIRITSSTSSGTDNQAMAFFQQTSGVGSITIGTSSTSFNTTSDYRLKENREEILDAIERVKELKPIKFNWIKEPGEPKVDGFYAHELAEVVPEAVTGEKDALDWEGNPEYQAIDQAKIVPLLAAALQQAISKIEKLETRIQILENK